MVKAAEPCTGHYFGRVSRFVLDRPPVRCVLLERVVDSVLIISRRCIHEAPAQMRFIQRDDVIQKLSATASNPALGDSILPRSLNTRQLWSKTSAVQKCGHGAIELSVVVQNDITIRLTSRECLTELLQNPPLGRMRCDLDMARRRVSQLTLTDM